MINESEIKTTIIERRGVPPFTVWSRGFLDMRDGEPIPNSGMPPHSKIAENIAEATSLYRDVTDLHSGTDVKVFQVPRIVDSRGVQVYP